MVGRVSVDLVPLRELAMTPVKVRERLATREDASYDGVNKVPEWKMSGCMEEGASSVHLYKTIQMRS